MSSQHNGFVFVFGALLHIFYFRNYEHHMHGVRYLQTSLIAVATCTLSHAVFYDYARSIALLESLKLFSIFLVGVFSSLLIYRLLWHPLKSFPGPLTSKITSLSFCYRVRHSDAHKQLLRLHGKFGPIVRIGPSDLSIAHPLGVEAIYGLKSTCKKGSWYDEDWPRASIHTSRDSAFHSSRRRVWSNAFSDRALRGYEPRIARYNQMLVEKLASLGGMAVNASHWVEWWSFDVMGDLMFGKDFDMLRDEKTHWATKLLSEAMGLQGLKLPTWFFRMIVSIPGITAKYWSFIDFCDKRVMKRLEENPKVPDLMSSLLPTLEKSNNSEAELLNLKSDSRTAIIAGSDTAAATLVHALYFLAKYPENSKIIRREVAEAEKDGESLSNIKLQKLEHLNAVVNETLRLHPVVPSIIQRKTPPEGLNFGDVHIPGNMNVTCPQYVLGRDESIYADAKSFIPERWYSRPELILESRAFAPFSTGAYGCIGKPLALLEMRKLLADLTKFFDIVFAPGENGDLFMENTSDQFTLCLADLPLCFMPRQSQIEK